MIVVITASIHNMAFRAVATTIARSARTVAMSQSWASSTTASRAFAAPPSQLEVPAEAHVKVEPVASTSSASASQTVAASAPAKKSSSVWSRFTAFLTGVGVSSVYFFYTLTDDLAKSNASVEATLNAFKRDATSSNAELRQRIATLEHQVAALKQ